MSRILMDRRNTFDVPCTVEIEQTSETLHAHVVLDGDIQIKPGDEVMLITDRGQTIRTGVDDIRETGRNAQGVKLMSLDEGERIVAFERLAETPVEEDGGPTDSTPDGSTPGGSLPPPSMPPASDLN